MIKPPVKIHLFKPSLSPHSDLSKALSAYEISICFRTIPSYAALQESAVRTISHSIENAQLKLFGKGQRPLTPVETFTNAYVRH